MVHAQVSRTDPSTSTVAKAVHVCHLCGWTVAYADLDQLDRGMLDTHNDACTKRQLRHAGIRPDNGFWRYVAAERELLKQLNQQHERLVMALSRKHDVAA